MLRPRLTMMFQIQLCSLFQNLPTRALSVFMVRVGLPVDDASWHARSAIEWTALPAVDSPTLPELLKSTLTHAYDDDTHACDDDEGPQARAMNDFSELCVLHGLMSVGWDLRFRGGLRAAAAESVLRNKNWKLSLQRFY